ncbi:hypothetical protein N7457_001552 [Penicillium paradoxum]|uniref:uncharacterized protein n=1 Tax=Penicillium paradoxum TaxID=176176 RepID=UPI00254922EB|nr:uncharacterized protein N7457_001552 [Penicillium paradoxum]KAJ5794953.1 hypothetical protein N7457_001552 [Penicillium paradoxum]
MNNKHNTHEMDDSLLLVLLTKLSNLDRNKLIKHIQPPASDFQVDTWYPNDLLPSLAPQGQYRDSQANLYAIAIHLYRTGRSFFVVADSLTKRQLQGTAVRGESDAISVVLMAVRPSARDGEVRVIAKRSAMTRDENVNLLQTARSFEISHKFLADRLQCISLIYSDFGLQLHDPDRGIFARDTPRMLGHEQLSITFESELGPNIPLPAELVHEISSLANVTRSQSPVLLPAGSNFTPYRPYIHIFLTFRTSEEQIRGMQRALQQWMRIEYQVQEEKRQQERKSKGVRDAEYYDTDYNPSCVAFLVEPIVSLIPWNYSRVPSRRDVLRMRAATAEHPTRVTELPETRARPVDLLLEPLKDGEVAAAALATVYPAPCGLIVTQNTLSNLVEEVGLHNKTEKFSEFSDDLRHNQIIDSDKLEILPSVEIMSSYDDPFYSNPPPWQPVDRSMNSISLFYMTNRLTKQEDRALHDEIRTMNDLEHHSWSRKVISPVPWKPDQDNADDAGLDYMWEIVETVPESNHVQLPYFFADEQSGMDQTIIVMEKDYFFARDDDKKAQELLRDVPEPEFRGLRYARIKGRDAHTIFANLSLCNMEMEDFDLEGEGVIKLPRAGWPGHGVLFEQW